MTSRSLPIRLWPGIVAVAALLVARFGVKAFVPGFAGFSRGMMWSFGAAGAVLLWWLLLSRARWFERLGGIALIAAGLGVAWQLRHESMSLLWLVGYAVPGVCLALVAGAAVARRSPDWPRRATIAGAILLASLCWLLVRTEGISGDHALSFHWRWTASPEERLLAQIGREPAPAPAASASPATSPATVVPSEQASAPADAATPVPRAATPVPAPTAAAPLPSAGATA
ncbi:MAG TPA: hypothetical protein VIJ10_05305, partial [Vicinamibacteria bacterium]